MPPVPSSLTLALGFLLVLPDNLVISRLNLPALEATSVKSSPSVGLLELLAPCGGIPELQANWEVALVDLQKCYIHYIVLSVYGKTKCCTRNSFF
jgi:hypothetical protein